MKSLKTENFQRNSGINKGQVFIHTKYIHFIQFTITTKWNLKLKFYDNALWISQNLTLWNSNEKYFVKSIYKFTVISTNTCCFWTGILKYCQTNQWNAENFRGDFCIKATQNIARLLLEKGANVNAQFEGLKTSALAMAAAAVDRKITWNRGMSQKFVKMCCVGFTGFTKNVRNR